MKKIIATVLAALCVLAFAGCSDNSVKDVDLNEVMAKINTDYKISGMQEITDQDELCTSYRLENADVSAFAAEIEKNGLNEIVLIKAADAEAAARVETKLKERLTSKSNEIASYSPENYAIIKTCEVAVNGNYVRMIIAKDADGMKDVYNSYFN